jgi:3,5-epimerase/4-reductase
MNLLIFGNGYIGNKFLQELGNKANIDLADIGNINEIQEAIEKYKPDVIINTAGKTGKPNIDWCEDHKNETVYSNVTGPLVLAKIAVENNIKLVHIGSGCIYQGGLEKEYTEDERPDSALIPSFYSRTKAWSEEILSYFPVLQVRLRMPIDSEPNPRNLIWKISHYEKVMDQVPNSVSVIPDFIDATIKLIQKDKTGIYNVVNPGSITHGEILKMYKEIVDPSHTYQPISIEELAKITKAGRSNCLLSTNKIENEGIILPDIHERIREILVEYKKNIRK